MVEINGWLMDIYPAPHAGAILWLLDENGHCHQLTQPFPTTFYAAGPAPRLRALWKYLETQGTPLRLSRTQRRDLFQPELLTVLAVEVLETNAQPGLFWRTQDVFPELTFYDADISLPLRHAAAFGTFPLCRCHAKVGEDGAVAEIRSLDTPWTLDPLLPPLRILSLEPDCDPRRAAPQELSLRLGKYKWRFSLNAPRPLLVSLAAILRRHDPDLLLTSWGDSWLLPHLIELSGEWNIPLPLNRDSQKDIERRAERSYFSYGQVVHRDQQVLLFGRCHIDRYNAMLFHDYGLKGVIELSRVTSLALQSAARVSPGSGISAMQMVTALRHEVMVPWHKQQAERPKTAWQLMRSDHGGMVYQPITGLHSHVAELDFVSMYPSIMVHCNISPETVPGGREAHCSAAADDEELPPGLIPQTLSPLLDKRLALKRNLATMPHWDPRRRSYKALASAHKWLLVTCFGYLGYKNARFGRIEAHEAVTAYGREALLRAKEAAEDLGFTVLHLYVDGMWVKRPGAETVQELQPLLDEIADRTGLPIAMEGIYDWLVFLPSRVDHRVPTANRFFGVFQDGSLKLRGIDVRRRDTPRWVADAQLDILKLMARVPVASRLKVCLPAAFDLLRRRLADLRAGSIPLEHLLIAQKLSRELVEYRTLSPVARAATQLEAAGRNVRPGQIVRFLFMCGYPGVHAWDLPDEPEPDSIDKARYTTLLFRAASTVLQPLGMDETALRLQVFSRAAQNTLPGISLRH